MASSGRMAAVASVLVLMLLLVMPAAPSYVMFDLHGSVHPDGYLYVSMKIGEPAREYFLDVDTGSILTFVQCHIPGCRSGVCKSWPQKHPLYELTSGKTLSATDPLCKGLGPKPADPREKRCVYQIKYVLGSSKGFLIRDTFTFPVTQNSHQKIAFGCGYYQDQPEEKQVPVDGILGLGRSSSGVDLMSQLKKNNLITKDVIGHCISSHGTGFLYIGDFNPSSGAVTWVNMKKQGIHYSPVQPAYLYLGKQVIGKTPVKVIFDSGTTYTYFGRESYGPTRTAVEGSLDKTLTKVQDGTATDMICWKGTKEFKSWGDVKPLFKSISLVFGQDTHKATLEIPPENYLIITKNGNVCFGILDGSHVPGLGQINLIGAITMQDRVVIYDNVAGKIGWVNHSCKKSVSSRLSID